MSANLKIGIGLLILFIISILCYLYLLNIITYVLIAGIISLIGSPLMDSLNALRIGKYKLPRAVNAVITILSFYLLIVAFIMLFLPLIIDQFERLASTDFQNIASVLQEKLKQFDNWVIEHLPSAKTLAISEVSPIPDTSQPIPPVQAPPSELILSEITALFDPSYITNFFGSILGLLGNLFTALFAISFISFFFLTDPDLFYRIIFAIIPTDMEDKFQNVYNTSSNLLTRYFIGLVIQTLCVGSLVTIGLSILGVRYALLIGFFAGIINIIPYIGPAIGATFGIIVSLFTYTEVSLGVFLSIGLVFALIQTLDNIFFQPIIFSNSVNAHPLEIFLLILSAGTLGGIPFMIIAIPAYTVLRVVAKEFLSEFKLVQSLTSRL